jgi:hypothetical protein
MGKSVKWVLGILGVFALSAMAAGSASNLVGLTDKFQLFVGTPNIHNFSGGMVNLRFNNIRILNTTNLTASLKNLWVTVQYFDKTTNTWQNWILQTNTVAEFDLQANQLNNLPVINLAIPLSLDFISKAIKGNLGSNLKVITRFSFHGVTVPLEQEINASGIIDQFKRFNWVAA